MEKKINKVENTYEYRWETTLKQLGDTMDIALLDSIVAELHNDSVKYKFLFKTHEENKFDCYIGYFLLPNTINKNFDPDALNCLEYLNKKGYIKIINIIN